MKVIKKAVGYAVVLTLIIGIISPLALGKGPNSPLEPPGPPTPPPGSKQINITEVIPKQFKHNLSPGTPSLIRFQNMVMEINANRNMTVNITSDEKIRLRYFTMHMEMNQEMHLNIRVNATPPQGIPAPMYGLEKYFTIEPNSTSPFRATLRLYINGTELTREMNRTINMERLTWCYWNGTDWERVQSRYMTDGFLEANTTHFSHWTVKEQINPREMQPPNRPGIPAHAQVYNYTDMTPKGFQHQLKEHRGTMFQFNNTAVYLNSTHRLQLLITTENQFREHLLRLEVEPGEALRLEMHLRITTPHGLQAPEKTMGFYCEIEPNATISRAKLGALMDPAQAQARNMAMERLSWAYWNGTHWEPVESTLNEDNILEAETTHFSTWTVLELSEDAEPPEEPPAEPPEEPGYLLYGGAALLIIAVAAYLLYTRIT